MTFAANEQCHLLASHIFPIMPEVLDISKGFSALLCGLLVFHLHWMLIDSYMTVTEIKVIDSDYWVPGLSRSFGFRCAFLLFLCSAAAVLIFLPSGTPYFYSSRVFLPVSPLSVDLLLPRQQATGGNSAADVRENETGSPEVHRRSELRGGRKSSCCPAVMDRRLQRSSLDALPSPLACTLPDQEGSAVDCICFISCSPRFWSSSRPINRLIGWMICGILT